MASDISDGDCSPLLIEEEENERNESPVLIRRQNFSILKTFLPHVPRFLLTVLVDVVLPMLIYVLLHKRLNSVHALLLAGVPPFIMIIVKATRSRTFDALGFLVLVGFVASAIAALITHNPRIILMEKSLVTGFISLIFVVTLIPCHHRYSLRPLAFYFYQDLVPTTRAQIGLPDCIFEESEDERDRLSSKEQVKQVYEWLYAHCSSFRWSCYLITSIWSVGLFSEFLARFILILIRLSIDKIFFYGSIILTSITILLIVLTILCISIERNQTLKAIERWKLQYLPTDHASLTI